MNVPLAMHTAARRYCIDRHAYWCERYSEITRDGDRESNGYHYTPEALATFPRYNVLKAIRLELERIEPADLGDAESTRELLILAGQIADDVFTRPPNGDIECRAMAEEREAFCRHIRNLESSALGAIQELPYRRVLTSEESKSIWSRIQERWQVAESYWYPLAPCTLPDVAAFEARAFHEAVACERLQDMLAVRGIKRVWEFRESDINYEEDVSLLEPYYDLTEGYWFSANLDWLIYVSHESSVTVAGWLLHELRAAWPMWETHVWTGAATEIRSTS